MGGRRVAVMSTIRQVLDSGPVAGLDDGQLLERFATRNDEVAFAALVALHGPMVLGVCRRILHDGHDVEDAFQATFLVLVRRARSIRDPGRLGPWLHGVARRVALGARSEASRRRSHQDVRRLIGFAEDPAARPASRAEGEDVLDIIDQEISRLPARYREAVVLCDLEGRSYAEAAHRLRCPLGTLQSRLARGRARLRARLVRRGLAPSLLAAILAQSARAKVPGPLADLTVRAATAGAFPASVAALAAVAGRGMILSSIKSLAVALCVVSFMLGAGLLARDRLSAEPPAGAAPEPQAPETDRTLHLQVVDDADQSALAGASVRVQFDVNETRVSEDRADDEGHATIGLPDEGFRWLEADVIHPGFVPIELIWSGEEPIPDRYVVALERGIAIGGTVHDEQGRPIAGARVHLVIGARPPRGGPERYPSPESEIAAAVTDDQGRWRSDALPPSAARGVRLELLTTHPDHILLGQTVTADTLRSFGNTGVMKTGRSVSGVVTSPTGRPVAGATVVVQHSNNAGRSQRLRTDEAGRFRTGRFIDPGWDRLTLTVQADGFASALNELANTPEIPPQLVRLSPRRPLAGRVVDERGRPISGALVTPTWGLGNGKLDWQARTDAEGRFRWIEAPASGPIRLDVQMPGFRPIQDRWVGSGSDDLTLTLHRPQHLHGTISDSETGRPIERFTLISAWGPPQPGVDRQWERDKARIFTGGQFDLTGELTPDQDLRRSIRIEADGYEPAELRDFLDDQEDVSHDFKLRKSNRQASVLTGLVRGPDSRPVAGADVFLADREHRVRIHDGRPGKGEQSASDHVVTDREGRFAFPPRRDPAWMVIVHDSGFAMRSPADLAASIDLILAPWGRVEGLARIGRDPAPGCRISGYLQERRLPGQIDYGSETDREGRFVFERVAPGRLTVYSPVRQAEGQTLSNLTHVDVQPGQTVRVGLGGTGRPVVGRLAWPAGMAMSHFVSGFARLQSEPPPLPLPAGPAPLTDEQWTAWWAGFLASPLCEDYFYGAHQYAVTFQTDGTFRIEDVPAGRYLLKLPFKGNASGDQPARQAFARASVVVPTIPGGRSDEPLDIGVIPMEVFPSRRLGVGDRVPAIIHGAADGRPLDLAALRGKFVLLVFWSTSRRWALDSIAQVKATHDAFGRVPRLVVIGLNQDAEPEVMRRYLAHRDLPWEQRYIGHSDDPNPVASALGVLYPPQVLLIGPDGRIIARDLQGEAIRQAVAKALRLGD